MGQNQFSDDVKSRVTTDVKRRLEVLAKGRQLDLSDIVREALREYLQRHADEVPGQGELLIEQRGR